MKALLISLLGLIWLAPALAFQVTDDRGITTVFEKTPRRIVSLLPSLTESVCALGQCPRLVGVDRYSNYPDSVNRLPQLGGGIDPNLEAIVVLKPDLVLLSRSSRVSTRLEALGIKVVALETKNHADVKRVLHTLGAILAVPEEVGAAKLWDDIQTGLAAAAQSLPTKAKNINVYFEVNRGPYAASESSFIGETLQALGVRNVIPAALGPFPKLNPEFVLRANPDLIMLGSRSMQGRVDYPGWSGMKAIREQRICVFSLLDSDTVVRPGPRLAEAARIMAKCLQDQYP
jgi:iron complex transport system substrate-binding protein